MYSDFGYKWLLITVLYCIKQTKSQCTQDYYFFPLQRESPDFLARERHRHVPGHLHLPRVQRPHGVRGHPPAAQEAPEAESAGTVVDFILSLGHMVFFSINEAFSLALAQPYIWLLHQFI